MFVRVHTLCSCISSFVNNFFLANIRISFNFLYLNTVVVISWLPQEGDNGKDDQEDQLVVDHLAEEEDSFLKKGPWTAEEDAILAAYVTSNGVGNWNIVRKNTGLARCGKSCRLRWTNHLRPELKKGAFTQEEQLKVIQLHALMGNKWARMAQEVFFFLVCYRFFVG